MVYSNCWSGTCRYGFRIQLSLDLKPDIQDLSSILINVHMGFQFACKRMFKKSELKKNSIQTGILVFFGLFGNPGGYVFA
jgi:hypothetical protein